MQIKKIILSQFKGISSAEYSFNGNTIISGANGTGKTTIADAYFWLFTDKDYSMKANPEVHPDFMEESEPSVEIVCDIDGKEVSFRKFQKDSRTKKQKEAGAPVRISNQYEVNSVPVSQKDFVAKLVEYGVNVNEFTLFTHTENFTGMKSADCRKILFGMTSDVTDKSIADSLGDCEEVSDLLDNYTVEEIVAIQRRTKKEADQNLDVIPQQIIGMEKSKVQIDVKALEGEKTKLQEAIDYMENGLRENPLPSIGDLNQKIASLQSKQRMLAEQANAERTRKLADENLLEIKTVKVINEFEAKRDTANAEIQRIADRKAELERQYEKLAEDFKAAKEEKLDESVTICDKCGQPFPAERIDRIRSNFAESIEVKKRVINTTAAGVKHELKELEKQKVSVPDEKILEDLQKDLAKIRKNITFLSKEIDVSGTKEYKALEVEIAKVRQGIAEYDFKVSEQESVNHAISEKRIRLNCVSDQLAQTAVNDHIDQKIDEARQKQREYAQASANAEKILNQLSRISMEKNRLLTEQVNSHFDGVKFRLFEQQKNGEWRDDCTPMVLTKDGEYRDITFSANTAAIVRGQLAIISGLQKFYGQNLPVFLDGAECLDTEHSNIKTEYQLILLKVSDDKNLVIA